MSSVVAADTWPSMAERVFTSISFSRDNVAKVFLSSRKMKEKSAHLNMKEFNMENELSYVLKQLEQELSYYLSYAIGLRRNGAANMDAVMIAIEKIVNSCRRGLIDLYYRKIRL